MLDAIIKTTQNYCDEYKLMLTQNPSWNPNGNNGKGDCIGRTLDAYLAYEGFIPFIWAVKHCFRFEQKNGKTYIQGYRHPSYMDTGYNDMSRDHIYNMLIFMKLANENDYLKKLSKNLRWKISDRFTFTIDLWFWMKGIAGNKFAMFFYYLMEVPILFFSILWNKMIYKIGGFGKEVPQDEFTETPSDQLSEWKKKCRKLVYPMYTIYQNAFAMYASPNSLGKWLVKKILLWGIDEQNFLLRIMLGGKVDKEKVYSYKSMCDWRWSTYLNEMNDRELHIITDPVLIQANVLDVDLLRAMYEKFNPPV